MNITTTRLSDLLIVDTVPVGDHRGNFSRFFCANELSVPLGGRRIVQINHSHTREAGTIRGLHFQHPPLAEMKMVRCLSGRVWDIAVDLRLNSPTFLQWHAEELTPENRRMLVIPEGFAHGFQALEPNSQILYLVTAPYSPQLEAGLRHDDPRLAIPWPLARTDISLRDLQWPQIDQEFRGLSVAFNTTPATQQ